MLNHTDHFHGSDLEKIEKIYGISKKDMISFSANINPLGISPLLRSSLAEHIDSVSSYPDREYTELRHAIAKYCHTLPESVIVGNGSTELISLFIQTIYPQKALVLGPTYSEYEREISLCGGQTKYYPLKESEQFTIRIDHFCRCLNDDLDLLVLCNPNNPTGSALTCTQLRILLDSALEHGIFVLIDETYVEFAPVQSDISALSLIHSYGNVAVIRGTSKFFAAPGLRLGYALTGNRDFISQINMRQNPWTITSLSEAAGRLMFSDAEYIHRTSDLIQKERVRTKSVLDAFGTVQTYDSYANFMLVKILKENVTADLLFDHCIRQGLMIRNCSSFPFLDNRFFRFCFMLPEQNDRLLRACKELLA